MKSNLELVRAAMQSHISRRKRRNTFAMLTGIALTLAAAAVAMPDHDMRSTGAALASEIGQAPIYRTGV